ncbi:MAG: hypothetical protein HY021_06835 [Burkholderiales bacterium]|nr:hypothetical protein [Burkholderiales bacterium]
MPWLAAIMLTGTSAHALPAVSVVAGKVSVLSRGLPLNEVLRAIAAASGAIIRGADGLAEPVRWHVDQLPLADALRLLLSGQNFLMVEGREGHPTLVIVVGAPSAAQAAVPALATRPAPTPSRMIAAPNIEPASRIEAVEHAGDLNDAGSLALIQRAMADPSDAVRAVAAEALERRKARGADAASSTPPTVAAASRRGG